jgi:hypothetical protein
LAQEPLAFALSKLLVHGSSAQMPVENVYSAARADISAALERVVARFKREKLVLITSKAESVQLARGVSVFEDICGFLRL